MLASLRFRLLLSMLGVVLVVLGAVALFASRVTSRELQRYVELDLQRNQRLIGSFMSHYDDQTQAADPTVLVQQMGQEASERVILTDGSGKVLADSAGQLLGQTIGCADPAPAVIVTIGGAFCVSPPPDNMMNYSTSGSPANRLSDILFFGMPAVPATQLGAPLAIAGLATINGQPEPSQSLVIRRTQGQTSDPIEAGFLSAVNRSLLLAALAAGAAALLLTTLLSRRILGPIDALNAAVRTLGQGDLSQRVPASGKDEIGDLARAFNAMADGLARQEQLRRNMTTDVAHELRTPLTNIRGYLEALRDGVVKPHPALLDSLHEEALLLNRLVDDLQDLALAEAGQLRLDKRSIELAGVVNQAVHALQPAAAAKQIQLTTELQAELPPIMADPERVGQILRNLLHNAILHTPEAGQIAVAAHSSGAEIEICVRDSGSGIAPEHLPNIFERFYRADRARARSTGGAGLGLAIVKQLVLAHGGRVWAESRLNEGACFTFTLPSGSSYAALIAD